MIIYLGCRSPDISCNLPGNLGRAALHRDGRGIVPLFGLAPSGVCLAFPVARKAVSSYLTISPLPRL